MIFFCLPLFYLILQLVVLIGYVPSASMEPTLPEGSFIFGLRIFDEPQVGDIIVFEKDGVLQVKRVAAGPGDTVDLREIQYMNDYPEPTWESPVITVPDNCYFVLGDNRDSSNDSRSVGPIDRDMIVGHVRQVVYPFSQWRGIPNGLDVGK